MIDGGDYPKLFPSVDAAPWIIASDLDHHGCAYVVTINDEEYMIHPNMLVVYGTPKKHKEIDD